MFPEKRNEKVFYAILLGALLIIHIGVRIWLISERSQLTHDEAISFLHAASKASTYGRVIAERIPPYGIVAPVVSWANFLKPERFWVFGEILQGLQSSDIHPPLYFYLLHVWLYVFGSGLQQALLLNVLISVLSLLLLVRIVSQLTLSKRWGIGAGALWSLNPTVLETCLTVRQYELANAFLLLLVAGVLQMFVSETRRPAFVLTAIGVLGLMLTLYMGWIWAAVLLLLSTVLIPREWRREGMRLLAMPVLVGALFAVLLNPGFATSMARGSGLAVVWQKAPFARRATLYLTGVATLFWAPAQNEFTSRVIRRMGYYFIKAWKASGTTTTLGIAFVILVAVFAAVVVIVTSRRNINDPNKPARLLLVWLAISLFAIHSAAYLLGRLPHWSMGGRYVSYLATVIVLGVAAALAAPRHAKPMAISKRLSGLALFVLTVLLLLRVYASPNVPTDEFLSALALKGKGKIVVIDNTARGVFFPVVFSLSDGTRVLLADQSDLGNLLSAPGAPKGFLLCSWAAYSSTIVGREELLSKLQAEYEIDTLLTSGTRSLYLCKRK